MAPSAVLSKLRGHRRGSYSSSAHLDDHTPLPPLQTFFVQHHKFDEHSSPSASRNQISSYRIPRVSESSSDDLPASRMTALSKGLDEPHCHRPSSATAALERPGQTAAETVSAVASRAHNFVFSLQPPKKFTASLTPNDSPISSPNPGSGQVYDYRSSSKNVSTSSLPAAEDVVSSKSATSRLGKAKFNLLNPLSLLARRRSSQNQLPKAEDANLGANPQTVARLPHDYDPRIRGNIVHDFSIPKARRVNSYNGISSAETSPSVDSRPSTQSNCRVSEQWPPFASLAGRTSQSPAHSPLFKEHFTDDRQSLQPQNTGYLHALASSTVMQAANDPPLLPAFAKSLPLDVFGDKHEAKIGAAPTTADLSATSGELHVKAPPSPAYFPPSEEPLSQVSPSIAAALSDRPSPPVPEFAVPLGDLPKHMTSTSSRFSFQLSGMGSEAQERLLEEKHMQQVASKLIAAEDRDDVESEEERYAAGDFDDDGVLEEKIPGVNADLDEEVEEHPQDQSLASFHLTSLAVQTSPNAPRTGFSPSSRGNENQVLGLADTKPFPHPNLVPSNLGLEPKDLGQLPWFGGVGIASLEDPSSRGWTGIVQPFSPQVGHLQEGLDDMYFDDGNIESLDDVVNGDSFDEDIFDNEFGAIHDAPAQNPRNLGAAQQQNHVPLSEFGCLGQWSDGVPTAETAGRGTPPVSAGPGVLENASGPAEQQQELGVLALAQCSGLTEDNLAYQDALVFAANEAAARGRFSRHLSMSQDSEDLESKSQITESQPGLISDDSRISHFPGNAGAEDEHNEFPFEDILEDDPMIAEANAEVLENDDEGFYGQEFGFYARAHGKGISEMINGGYFGPRGVEGVHRSHSAKANFQEPSLTPITERSEWSRRNSFASIQALGLPPSAQAIQSPGIAQLLDFDPLSFEDKMSLSALMKLRRDAWGGSQASLSSPGASQTGNSPKAQLLMVDGIGLQPAGIGNRPFNGNGFPRHSYDSAASFAEGFEEETTHLSSDASGTQSTLLRSSDSGPQSRTADAPERSACFSQSSQATNKATKSHSRASSGAESVSYMKDPDGSGRWLLERRRTGEDGELELVGREYVAGARI